MHSSLSISGPSSILFLNRLLRCKPYHVSHGLSVICPLARSLASTLVAVPLTLYILNTLNYSQCPRYTVMLHASPPLCLMFLQSKKLLSLLTGHIRVSYNDTSFLKLFIIPLGRRDFLCSSPTTLSRHFYQKTQNTILNYGDYMSDSLVLYSNLLGQKACLIYFLHPPHPA